MQVVVSTSSHKCELLVTKPSSKKALHAPAAAQHLSDCTPRRLHAHQTYFSVSVSVSAVPQ